MSPAALTRINTYAILSSDYKHVDRAEVASKDVQNAAHVLATRVDELLGVYGQRPEITSGYRTPAANKAAGGAPGSAHLEGRAVDLSDPEGRLGQWCLNHLYLLEKIGLWLEDPLHTKTWCHLQSRPAGHRVFKP